MNTDDPSRVEGVDRITEAVIGCAYRVHGVLGYGFLEKVYENALVHELRKSGLACVQQQTFGVRYDGIEVGVYVADLIVEGTVLVELKAAKAVDDGHVAQCLNYLAVTGLPVCLMLNVQRRVQVRRFAGDLSKLKSNSPDAPRSER